MITKGQAIKILNILKDMELNTIDDVIADIEQKYKDDDSVVLMAVEDDE